MPNRFVDDAELEEIDLGDGDWVKIPARISFEIVEQIGELEGSNLSKTVPVLLKVIKAWNIETKDGTVAQITAENIRRLDMETVGIINRRIAAKITPEEKKG